jgi:hypothetical protein
MTVEFRLAIRGAEALTTLEGRLQLSVSMLTALIYLALRHSH